MCEGSSLIELFDQFPDDVSAERWFEDQRWPDGRFCPRSFVAVRAAWLLVMKQWSSLLRRALRQPSRSP